MSRAVLVTAALYATGAAAFRIDKKAANTLREKLSCKCLNWKETYAAGLVECGQGFEFTAALGYPKAAYGTAQDWLAKVQDKTLVKTLHGQMGMEFCESFYKRFDDTKCARTAMDSSPTEWYGKSWCYVSKDCGSAMAVTGSQVSAKLCEEGKDSLLSDMDPKTLMAYGEHMGFFVPGYFVKVAYPVDRDFFYSEAATHQAEIAALKASGKPVVVDFIDEHKDKMIIAGDRVFNLPNSYDGFKCVENCEDIYSFAPKDGLVCYQGPQSAMTTLFNNVRQGMNQLMFVNSELWSSPCKDHGFTLDFLGQTCYGNTFATSFDLKPHTDAEHFYSQKFQEEHSPEESLKALTMMVCASCQGHC